ncbi:terminase small subunit [Arthrobacter sp. AK04]|uniref:terminase small subunit n=1 Tax=Arthrobacter sp. AK04 TaxID=2900048 RepID=UPI0035ABA0AA
MAKVAHPEQEEDKHPGGRPLAFPTVEALDLAIQLYFDRCDPHIEPQMTATGVNANGKTLFDTREVLTEQKPYTMTGLARALKVDRKTLLNYKNRDEFFPSIQGALMRCAEYAESNLFGPYANGAKFALTNNYSEAGAERLNRPGNHAAGLLAASSGNEPVCRS